MDHVQVKEIDSQMAHVNVLLDELEFYENRFHDNTNDTVDKINNKAEALVARINRHRNKLLDELEGIREMEQGLIDEHKSMLETNLASLGNIRELTANMVDYARSAEIVDMKNMLDSRLPVLEATKPGHIKHKVEMSFMHTDITKMEDQQLVDIYGITEFAYKQTPQKSIVEGKVLKRGQLISSVKLDLPGVKISGMYTMWNRDTVIVGWKDKRSTVYIMDSEFKQKGTIGTSAGNGKLLTPFDVAVLRNDFLAITDNEARCVCIYTPSGHFIRSFGHSVLLDPTGIAINSKNSIYVVDRVGKAVYVYTASGKLEHTIHEHDGQNYFKRPLYIAINSNEDMVVSDLGGPSIKVFDYQHRYKYQFGIPGVYEGEFWGIQGVACDTSGYILAADCGNHRILLVTSKGEFKRFLLTKDNDLCQPTCIQINHKGELLVGEQDGMIKTFAYLQSATGRESAE